jgi:hypothetical protein
MTNKILEWIASKMHLREIYRLAPGDYLHRFGFTKFVDGPAGHRRYLHHFLAEDDEGHHNHPWKWSFSIVLRGGYTEEYFDSRYDMLFNIPVLSKRRVRWFNFIGPTKYHRITELHGDTWTLFFCGGLTGKGWGFWIPGRGHVDFKTRMQERGVLGEIKS